MLMQVTTEPIQVMDAVGHTGGWSESWWTNSIPRADQAGPFLALMTARANLLPLQAGIVGFRIANYTISGNKLLPGGAQTGRILKRGTNATTDLPQVALEIGCTSAEGNSSQPSLRCIPDVVMKQGEYQPSATFRNSVIYYCSRVVEDGWCILGRNLTLPTARVLSIVAGVATLSGPIGAVAGESYIRLGRVKDQNGRNVQGAFYCSAIGVGNLYTLTGLPQGLVVGESGTARVDAIVLRDITGAVASRAVARKVGAPFQRYRGRASKRAVA